MSASIWLLSALSWGFACLTSRNTTADCPSHLQWRSVVFSHGVLVTSCLHLAVLHHSQPRQKISPWHACCQLAVVSGVFVPWKNFKACLANALKSLAKLTEVTIGSDQQQCSQATVPSWSCHKVTWHMCWALNVSVQVLDQQQVIRTAGLSHSRQGDSWHTW